ncbi:hypothetical protein ElyMa_002624200 [Elysia marginata]|uniref:Uncharacterized protein n=1 Tax=Elysia marginata TaxID=1093978 RepID=A0AAV4H3P8_9GAST|nr:hypothetical protein ElyMa_002624200 [Elysia marginata]
MLRALLPGQKAFQRLASDDHVTSVQVPVGSDEPGVLRYISSLTLKMNARHNRAVFSCRVDTSSVEEHLETNISISVFKKCEAYDKFCSQLPLKQVLNGQQSGPDGSEGEHTIFPTVLKLQTLCHNDQQMWERCSRLSKEETCHVVHSQPKLEEIRANIREFQCSIYGSNVLTALHQSPCAADKRMVLAIRKRFFECDAKFRVEFEASEERDSLDKANFIELSAKWVDCYRDQAQRACGIQLGFYVDFLSYIQNDVQYGLETYPNEDDDGDGADGDADTRKRRRRRRTTTTTTTT